MADAATYMRRVEAARNRAPAMTPDQARAWNAMTVDQRIMYRRYLNGGRIDVNAENQIITDWVEQQYGQYAAYLDIPEVRGVLMRGAREGWTPERLQAELMRTGWWKSTSAAQREFDLLEASDPKTASEQGKSKIAQIEQYLSQQGLTGRLNGVQVARLARAALRNGVPDESLPRMILAQVNYRPTQPVGEMGARMSALKARAAEYGVLMSDRGAYTRAERIAAGLETEQGAEEFLRQTALAKFANNEQIRTGIEQGHTVRTLIDPMIQEVAQALEIDPDTVDILDREWSPLVSYADPTQGGKLRAMTAGEAAQFARQKDAYEYTRGGRAEGAGLSTTLLKSFGASA